MARPRAVLFSLTLLACSPAPMAVADSPRDPSSPAAAEGVTPSPSAPAPAAAVAASDAGAHDHHHHGGAH